MYRHSVNFWGQVLSCDHNLYRYQVSVCNGTMVSDFNKKKKISVYGGTLSIGIGVVYIFHPYIIRNFTSSFKSI